MSAGHAKLLQRLVAIVGQASMLSGDALATDEGSRVMQACLTVRQVAVPAGCMTGLAAEHGIGLEKKTYFSYARGEAEIELMHKTGRMMDPGNILNPARLFDL